MPSACALTVRCVSAPRTFEVRFILLVDLSVRVQRGLLSRGLLRQPARGPAQCRRPPHPPATGMQGSSSTPSNLRCCCERGKEAAPGGPLCGLRPYLRSAEGPAERSAERRREAQEEEESGEQSAGAAAVGAPGAPGDAPAGAGESGAWWRVLAEAEKGAGAAPKIGRQGGGDCL